MNLKNKNKFEMLNQNSKTDIKSEFRHRHWEVFNFSILVYYKAFQSTHSFLIF